MFVTQIIGNGVSQVSYKVLVTKKYSCEVMIIESLILRYFFSENWGINQD